MLVLKLWRVLWRGTRPPQELDIRGELFVLCSMFERGCLFFMCFVVWCASGLLLLFCFGVGVQIWDCVVFIVCALQTRHVYQRTPSCLILFKNKSKSNPKIAVGDNNCAAQVTAASPAAANDGTTAPAPKLSSNPWQ